MSEKENGFSYKTLEQMKNEYISFILYRSKNQEEAAEILGVSVRTIRNHARDMGLERPAGSKSYYKDNSLVEKLPIVKDTIYDCMPNITVEERDFIANRSLNSAMPTKISTANKYIKD